MFSVKSMIKQQIEVQYGSIGAFVEKHGDKGLDYSTVSKLTNPKINSTLESMKKILDVLELDFSIRKKVVFNHRETIKA